MVSDSMKTSSTFVRIFSLATLMMALGMSAAKSAPPQFILVGTGGVTGIYYAAGGAVCRMVNKQRKESGVRCSVEIMQGSIANLNSLASGEIDLAVVQSDAEYYALHGEQAFSDQGANTKLRSLLTLHPESFTVVARADAGISSFNGLKGKRVNIGNPGSGQREIMDSLMSAKGWTTVDFSASSEMKSDEQSKALCANEIDAFVFTVGHPAGALKEAANNCEVVILSVEGPEVDALLAENSFYRKTVVPGGVYRGNPNDTHTFGVSASLVASADISSDTAYLVVKNVFENIDSLQKMHPAFGDLNVTEMAATNPGIPVHKGAARYYKEAKLK